MYSANCPKCGVTLATTVAGQAWLKCATCGWSGLLVVTPAVPGLNGATSGGVNPVTSSGTVLNSPHPAACPACFRLTYGPGMQIVGMPPQWFCTSCGYLGSQPSASASTSSPSGVYGASAGATQPAQQSPADAGRDAVRALAQAIVGDVCAELRTLTDADWRATLPQVYERMQRAHEPLYTALGGTHMGDYHPNTHAIREALVTQIMWQVIALYAAEQVEW